MTDYPSILKEIRSSMLLSQEELAQELGVTFATVNRWENSHHEPSLKGKKAIRDYCKKHGLKDIGA